MNRKTYPSAHCIIKIHLVDGQESNRQEEGGEKRVRWGTEERRGGEAEKGEGGQMRGRGQKTRKKAHTY